MDIEKNESLENEAVQTEIIESEQPEQSKQETVQENTPEMILPPQYQPKPLFELTKGDTAFAILAVLTSIFTSVFGIFGGVAFGYLLSLILTLTLFTVYFAKGTKIGASSVISGLLAFGNSAVFICTTNGSVRFFGVIISFLLLLVCFDGLRSGEAKGNRQTIGVFYSAVSTIDNIGVAIKSLFSNQNGDKKAIGKALLGLLCAIPVLIVVVPLLISSDDAFRGMMSNIFSNTFTTILKVIFGLMISLFVIPYGFSLKSGRVAKIKEGNFTGIENVYIISFLSAIGACYLLYLFSQLAYFFSAFRGFLPDTEFTYAEYARKGFFEMCVIAVINLVISLLALIIAKKQDGRVCHGIKALTTFIAVFTLIIIATAISKMVLYIDTYGMTVLRLTTSAFMLFLAIVFISVILRIFIININIVKTSLIAAGCIVLVLGTVNVNAVCAHYNYESYKSKKLDTIDVKALYDLGDEGIPYIVKLTDDYNSDTIQEAKIYLSKAYSGDYFYKKDDLTYFTVEDLKKNQKVKGFARFSIPKYKAYESLYRFIEKDSGFRPIYTEYTEEMENNW